MGEKPDVADMVEEELLAAQADALEDATPLQEVALRTRAVVIGDQESLAPVRAPSRRATRVVEQVAVMRDPRRDDDEEPPPPLDPHAAPTKPPPPGYGPDQTG